MKKYYNVITSEIDNIDDSFEVLDTTCGRDIPYDMANYNELINLYNNMKNDNSDINIIINNISEIVINNLFTKNDFLYAQLV
jgi:uncharacterized protein YqgQ